MAKLSINSIRSFAFVAKEKASQYVTLYEYVLKPQAENMIQRVKAEGFDAWKAEMLADPRIANQYYAAKETALAFANASFADKVAIIKLYQSTYAYAKEVCPFFNTPTVKGDYKGIAIKESSEACFFTMGILPEQPAAALVQALDGEIFILVNEGFYSMSEAHQEAILAHEYGHYVHDHLSKSQGARNLEHELEADAYSQSQGHDIIGALEFMRSKNALIRNQKEMSIRIAALKANQ